MLKVNLGVKSVHIWLNYVKKEVGNVKKMPIM